MRTNHRTARAFVAAVVLLSVSRIAWAQDPPRAIRLVPAMVMQQILADEDTDGDRKITVHDPFITGTERGNRVFWITATDGREFQVAGVASLANLLQELAVLKETGVDTAWLPVDRITEPPADRVSRSIRELFWNGLTRTVDEDGLPGLLSDEKMTSPDGFRYVYVPEADALAREYFNSVGVRHPAWKMRVRTLPAPRAGSVNPMADGQHGILSLALRRTDGGRIAGVPFVVPGGRFNEMYGWDSYFIILGLLEDNRLDLARGMVDNMVYEIEHYGSILNANRSYYLTRSQPPFLTSAARACYARMRPGIESRAWLRKAIAAAIHEYHYVWMNADRLTDIGLSRYFDVGSGPSPEVEPGHFDLLFAPYARARGLDLRTFETAYRSGRIHVPELDTAFVHDRAMRESGHDTGYRLVGVCADLTTVDLNALLYKIELDIGRTINEEFGDTLCTESGEIEQSAEWLRRAAVRKETVDRYLWNPTRGMYFDYNVRTQSQTGYISATTFWPLWAGLASAAQARKVVENALAFLEEPGGLAATAEVSRGPISAERPERQWDYPFGWAPHQMLAWEGLIKYGYGADAQRLVYKWLFTITLNAAQYNGTVPEKFDVARRTHEVYAEYGNVGTKFNYITREGFGWTNASFQVGMRILGPSLRESLNRLIPPEFSPALGNRNEL